MADDELASAFFFSSSFATKAAPARAPGAAGWAAAREAGSERPRDAEAAWLLIRGGGCASPTGFPPIDLPLPEKALKPAAAELLLAAVDAVELDSAAELSDADDEPLPMKPEAGKISPPAVEAVVMKYSRS